MRDHLRFPERISHYFCTYHWNISIGIIKCARFQVRDTLPARKLYQCKFTLIRYISTTFCISKVYFWSNIAQKYVSKPKSLVALPFCFSKWKTLNDAIFILWEKVIQTGFVEMICHGLSPYPLVWISHMFDINCTFYYIGVSMSWIYVQIQLLHYN